MRISLFLTQQFDKYLLSNYYSQDSENAEITGSTDSFFKDFTVLGKTDTKGNLVYCGKYYDRDLHKISWEHEEGMYHWMSGKDFTDDVMPHLNHLDFNKAFEIIPNIFVVKINLCG